MGKKEKKLGTLDMDQVFSPQTCGWIRVQAKAYAMTPAQWIASRILNEYMASLPPSKDGE